MPSFCRHNRLVQNCPICAREQSIELRPIVSSSAPRTSSPPPARAPRARTRASTPGARAGSALRVRRLARGVDDGYSSPLLPGLRSSEEAGRLAEELAFSSARLRALERDPPGLYAEVADPAGDVEERTWLAFLIAYLGPLDDQDPFTAIDAARTPWRSDAALALEHVRTGPRAAHEPGRGTVTLEAYRVWAHRSGSQQVAFTGEPEWTPERRFARAFERLALPGLRRDARFELLVTLGWLGVYELRPGALQLGGSEMVTLAAKRLLGIGDPLLLERRAAALAEACELPLAALDLAFYNWELGKRAGIGMSPGAISDPEELSRVRSALEL